jgi:hypothetical protein
MITGGTCIGWIWQGRRKSGRDLALNQKRGVGERPKSNLHGEFSARLCRSRSSRDPVRSNRTAANIFRPGRGPDRPRSSRLEPGSGSSFDIVLTSLARKCGTFSRKSHVCPFMGCKGSWVRIPPSRPIFPLKNQTLNADGESGRDSSRRPALTLILPCFTDIFDTDLTSSSERSDGRMIPVSRRRLSPSSPPRELSLNVARLVRIRGAR